MKKYTNQNRAVSLQSIGIIFVLLLNTAFVCGGSNDITQAANSTVSTTSVAAVTEAIVKGIITKQENNVTKYSTGPRSVTVTFESVKIGKTRKANKADEYEGIPAGATVYPVRAKFTTVQQYDSGDKTKENHYDYDFYEDSFGEWAALGR